MMRPLFAGNWKMNMRTGEARSFCDRFFQSPAAKNSSGDIWIAPPFTAIATVVEQVKQHGLREKIAVGAQNCHWLEKGAHTGEISPQMLVDLGCSFVILGHSERRQFYGETDADVAKRAQAALTAGLKVIICVGESETEFRADKTESVVGTQLKGSLADLPLSAEHVLIAYEPVWAIGTGLAADAESAARVHAFIRREVGVEHMRILYGGSVNPGNIAQYCGATGINGGLIGGASLDPDGFAALIDAGRNVGKPGV